MTSRFNAGHSVKSDMSISKSKGICAKRAGGTVESIAAGTDDTGEKLTGQSQNSGYFRLLGMLLTMSAIASIMTAPRPAGISA